MRAALVGAVRELAIERREEMDIREAIESVDRHELVSELAGTDDRRSRAYLSQARNVQRYVTDAGETRAPRGRLVAVLSALTAVGADDVTDDVSVEFEGAVVVSPGGRTPDERQRDFVATVSADDMSRVMRALAAGDVEDAADAFESAMFEDYGIHASAAVTDVDHLGLAWS